MEIRLNRVELLNELVPMQGIVERRTTIPVLSHLLLRTIEDRLEIAATDLEVSLTSSCDGEMKDEGAIAIQAKKLLEIIRASSGDEVTLRIDQPGQLTILVGKSLFKVRGLSAEDFPVLPSIEAVESFEVPFKTFKGMIGKVFFAISGEESRFQLSGALMRQNEGTLCLVATDGHRLALVESAVEGLGESDGVIVPRKALQEIQRFDSEAPLAFRRGEHHLSFTVGRRQLICRILEGTFPDYERVIAKDNDKKPSFVRKDLGEAVSRVALLTGDRARAVKLQFTPDQMVISAANPDLGEAVEEVVCEYEGPEFRVGINPDYLTQFLSVVETEKVRLELKDENTQCVGYPVEGPDSRYLCVIMPMRI